MSNDVATAVYFGMTFSFGAITTFTQHIIRLCRLCFSCAIVWTLINNNSKGKASNYFGVLCCVTLQIATLNIRMKCTIPEISWHNRDPVLSVDIQPKPLDGDKNNTIRLASGGSDSHVLVCLF